MKIISFNVNNDYRNIINNAQTIIEMINKHDPDIVGLQEITLAMYGALTNLLNKNYNISAKPKDAQSFFNVLLSKYSDEIINIPFTNTNMNRSFCMQHVESLNETFITTHLESCHINLQMRLLQCDELHKYINVNTKSNTFFGDTNFRHDEQLNWPNFKYIESTTNDVYTFDSLLNKNATPPFRSNLDRFYTNKVGTHCVDIFVDVTFSDHFPIMMTMNRNVS